MNTELEQDIEVRIKLLEKLINKFDQRFDLITTKIETQFYWTIGTIITLFFGFVTIHK